MQEELPYERDEGQEATVRPARAIPLPFHGIRLTHALLLVNTVVYLLLTLLAPYPFMDALVEGADRETLVRFGAKVNGAILRGEYWRLLTPIFLHIGLPHLLFNQYALLLFGRQLEMLFGTFRFATIYLLTGLSGSLASFLFNPAISAGASGAIFGIVGALTLFFLKNRAVLGEMGRQQFRNLLGLIGINLLLGFFVLSRIDNWGHLGGLLSGLLLGWLLAPNYTLRPLPAPPFMQVVEQRPSLPPALVALAGLLVLLAGTLFALPYAPR